MSEMHNRVPSRLWMHEGMAGRSARRKTAGSNGFSLWQRDWSEGAMHKMSATKIHQHDETEKSRGQFPGPWQLGEGPETLQDGRGHPTAHVWQGGGAGGREWRGGRAKETLQRRSATQNLLKLALGLWPWGSHDEKLVPCDNATAAGNSPTALSLVLLPSCVQPVVGRVPFGVAEELAVLSRDRQTGVSGIRKPGSGAAGRMFGFSGCKTARTWCMSWCFRCKKLSDLTARLQLVVAWDRVLRELTLALSAVRKHKRQGEWPRSPRSATTRHGGETSSLSSPMFHPRVVSSPEQGIRRPGDPRARLKMRLEQILETQRSRSPPAATMAPGIVWAILRP